ncbi:MAG TPA: Rv3235 family protein [Intrasporangium sp.]|uniref:Rv3235 family protein n=1 Tax=Intrasporangium sp. TaxID=1925024 RepID=UPI002D76D20A|nr:Rv3235 family protein [Intrasporangium sp.]HET7400004.1 Rv3235 family protein [Intrasporangium sp.]
MSRPVSPPALRVRLIPQTAPRTIPADEAYAGGPAPGQESLALDFFPPDEDGAFERRRSRTAQLGDPAPFVAKMAQAIVEVVSGQRPPPQLIRHTTPRVYSVLARRALVSARRQQAGTRRGAVVRRIRLCEPADGVVEAAAVVVAHGRVRALALRLEGLDGRWLVTQLTIG